MRNERFVATEQIVERRKLHLKVVHARHRLIGLMQARNIKDYQRFGERILRIRLQEAELPKSATHFVTA